MSINFIELFLSLWVYLMYQILKGSLPCSLKRLVYGHTTLNTPNLV